MTTMNSDLFYAQLPSFSHFDQFIEPQYYHNLPDDWQIVIADIKGSTQAIADGRYRDVNALGVACIVAVLNACKPLSLPFIFGGDGATFAVPASQRERVLAALAACVEMAAKSFALMLRVGCVPVAQLRAQGWRAAVAKYAVNAHYQQAMLLGDAWSQAERLIKSDERYLTQGVMAATDVDFSGFECRWNEIPSTQGESVCVLATALSDHDGEKRQLYREILQQIRAIYGSEVQHHPVPITQLKLSFSWRKLAIESRIRQANQSASLWRYRCNLLLLALAGKYLMQRKITTAATQWGEYKQRLQANTDYRKFDDMLRMVIAGTALQRERLTAYLSSLNRDGKIAFGVHASKAALITCVVSDYNYRHWHFVDGSDGGYAMAATQMKQQLASRNAEAVMK